MEITSPLITVFVLLFISQDCTKSTKYMRLILIIGMKLCVTKNQLVNSSYLTPSNLASPIFSVWLLCILYSEGAVLCSSFHTFDAFVFSATTSPQIYLILETRFERSVLQRQPIRNKTETNQ